MHNKQFLFFVTGDKIYGIDVLKIQAIERVGNITRVPKAPESTIGIMNLRGNIVPILSFRQKIGLELCGFEDQMRIIVLDDEEDRVGVLVDKVLDVREVDISQVYTDNDVKTDRAENFIQGAVKHQEDMLVTILDSDELIKI